MCATRALCDTNHSMPVRVLALGLGEFSPGAHLKTVGLPPMRRRLTNRSPTPEGRKALGAHLARGLGRSLASEGRMS